MMNLYHCVLAISVLRMDGLKGGLACVHTNVGVAQVQIRLITIFKVMNPRLYIASACPGELAESARTIHCLWLMVVNPQKFTILYVYVYLCYYMCGCVHILLVRV